MIRILAILSAMFLSTASTARPLEPLFSSPDGGEYEVSFDADYEVHGVSLEALRNLTRSEQEQFVQSEIVPVFDYLFGPLTRREIGSPKRSRDVEANWTKIRTVGERILIPYHYRGTWILDRENARGFTIPIPLNQETVFTPEWLNCTDSAPEHRTRFFYWYFWDPRRAGCDQKEGVNFTEVKIHIGRMTVNQDRSFPEYARMTGKGELKLTMAFGYVQDPARPKPETDMDFGVSQYREFVRAFRAQWGSTLTEQPILQSEYPTPSNPAMVIGRRFSGILNGVQVTMNIVVNAGVDQIELFAKSFAHDHDDVFAWFGHSRVGSGFDATRFAQLVAMNPAYYSVTTNYQLVYWAGCNSYSYYTVPFFKFKADASGGRDPQGTKNLDILANGLPSLFSLNAQNATIFTSHLLNWRNHSSYQTIMADIKSAADNSGQKVLVAALGDEDNEER